MRKKRNPGISVVLEIVLERRQMVGYPYRIDAPVPMSLLAITSVDKTTNLSIPNQQQLTRSTIRALRLLLKREALLDVLIGYDAPPYDLVCVNLPEVSGGCRCDTAETNVILSGWEQSPYAR